MRTAVNHIRSLNGLSDVAVGSPILDLVEYLERRYPIVDSVEALFTREGDGEVFGNTRGGDSLVLPDTAAAAPSAQLLFSEQVALHADAGSSETRMLVAALRTGMAPAGAQNQRGHFP